MNDVSRLCPLSTEFSLPPQGVSSLDPPQGAGESEAHPARGVGPGKPSPTAGSAAPHTYR